MSNEREKVLSVEAVNSYLEYNKKVALKTAVGTILCILSPLLLMVLSILTDESFLLVSPTVSSVIGLSVLFIMVIIAVILFMTSFFSKEKYEYIFEENFMLDESVLETVKNNRKKTNNKYNCLVLIGVILCILSPIPLIVVSFFDNIYLVLIALCLLFLTVSVAVYFFVYTSTITEGFSKILELK